MFEEEKRRRIEDIQKAIQSLNIASADKQKLTSEVENLNREQRTLQAKIDEFERELEGERTRKRALEREINELSLQINHKRLSGAGSTETSRMQFLREEIAKKQVQISSVQREYKTLLEQRTDSILSTTI